MDKPSIVLQGNDGSYQVVLASLDSPKLEITENGETIKYDGLEQQLKNKITDSLSQEDQETVLEYLTFNMEFPQTFLEKFLPRTKEKVASEIRPKIQTVIEQYLKSKNLTIDGYTCLSEKMFRNMESAD